MSYFKAKMHQIDFSCSSASDPAGGTPPNLVTGFDGLLREGKEKANERRGRKGGKGEGRGEREAREENKGRQLAADPVPALIYSRLHRRWLWFSFRSPQLSE